MMTIAALDGDELLTEVQAAELLRVSVRTLQHWRSCGAGPVFVVVGRARRYRRRDLITFCNANTVHPGAKSAVAR